MSLTKIQMNEYGIKEKAFKLCQNFLGPPWNKITMSDFKFSEMSGGLSSILYRCSLRKNVVLRYPKTPTQVLLRFYGPMQDTEYIIAKEVIIFVILAEKHLGPRLLGLFPNGRLEEFIPSRTLNTDDIRPMSTVIAKTLARIHALNVPLRKVPDQIPLTMKKWLKEVEKHALCVPKNKFSLGDTYRKEIFWISKEMEKSKSPVVFCHNDLQGGNILLREDSSNEGEPNLMFIDFEYSGYNYRSYDIANHFCEWAYDYNTNDPPYFTLCTSKYPSREEKVNFVRAYLEQLVQENVMDASDIDEEVDVILDEIKLFRMAAHLYWALWSEKMNLKREKSSFYIEHGKTRLALYWKLKENYMKEKSQQNGLSSFNEMKRSI